MLASATLRIRSLKTINILLFIGCTLVISLFYYIQTESTYNSYGLELDYAQPFLYPVYEEDFPRLIEIVKSKGIEGSPIQPLNSVFKQTEFLHRPPITVDNLPIHSIGLLVIVKSARENSAKRNLVRTTWGDKDYLKEEAILAKDLSTKLVFICGTKNSSESEITETSLTEEMNEHEDIIIGDFVDTYYNNTFKSILALKWSLVYGQDFQYLALVDDDIHFNVVNLCKYLRNLVYERVSVMGNPKTGYPFLKLTHQRDGNSRRISTLDQGVMIGHAKWSDPVVRDSTGERKWSVSYEDYPYKIYPPYHPGAGIIFDRRAVKDIYFGSLFVKRLRMDDVFLGIIAAKLKMLILDCPDVNSDGRYISPERVDELIILHGLEQEQLETVWINRDFSNLTRA